MFLDVGRKSLYTEGEEHEGLISYNAGIDLATSTVNEAGETADPETIFIVEDTYLQQELYYCNPDDTQARKSLQDAVQNMEDGLQCIKTLENPDNYRIADTTYPHDGKHRFHSLPRDAVHTACLANQTRINNSLRTPGINMTEKALMKQRIKNMKIALTAYMKKQAEALGIKNE
jgi:alpha-galactosidase/6-phospho-beta-glucosidase family protein